MFQCDNHTNGTLLEGCSELHLAYIYAIAVSGLLLTSASLVLFVVSLRSICKKKKRAKIARQSQTRGSVRRGSAYNIITLEEQRKSVPEYSTRFEYVDVLAEANDSSTSQSRTLHSTSCAVTANTQERDDECILSDMSQPEERADYEQVYDEPDLEIVGFLDENRSGTGMSGANDDHHTSMHRELHARQSTRSMPGIIRRQTSVELQILKNSESDKSQVFKMSGRAPHRQRVRSMFDPLPDIPVGRSVREIPIDAPLIEIEPVESLSQAPKLLSSNHSIQEHTLTNELSLKVTCTDNVSEKQFAFEDGTILGGDSDIPSFQDPEIVSQTSDHKALVSIYSSQILSKYQEESGMSTDDEDESDVPGPYTVVETQPLSFQHEALESSKHETEVVYDDPVIITKQEPHDENIESKELSLTDIKDPANLFDSPGYAKGLMTAQQEQVAHDQYGIGDILPQQHETQPHESLCGHLPTKREFESEEIAKTFPRRILCGLDKHHNSTPQHETDSPEHAMLSAQMKKVHGLSLDSMAIFDFKDDELCDLDPDIASCLVATDNDHKQVSYV